MNLSSKQYIDFQFLRLGLFHRRIRTAIDMHGSIHVARPLVQLLIVLPPIPKSAAHL